MANMLDGGRDQGAEPCEYCDNRFLDACEMDMGRGGIADFRDCGEVMSGGNGGWLGLEVGELIAGGGEAAGDEAGDMTAVIFEDS